MNTTSWIIPKVRKKDKKDNFHGLYVNEFLIPFQLPEDPDDLIVALDDTTLIEGQHYAIDRSLLIVQEQSLGLNVDDSLEVKLTITDQSTTDS